MSVVVDLELIQIPLKIRRVPERDVVQILSTNRSNESLNERV